MEMFTVANPDAEEGQPGTSSSSAAASSHTPSHTATNASTSTHTTSTHTATPDLTTRHAFCPFRPGPFVTFREPVTEISSLLSEMYLEEGENSDGSDSEENIKGADSQEEVVVQEISSSIRELQTKVSTLEGEFRASIESTIDRELGLREYVDNKFEDVETRLKDSVQQLERAVVECLLRRDEQWGKELSKVKRSSTPLSQASFRYPPPDLSDIGLPPSSKVSATPSLIVKPPVRLQFPVFGESREATEVFNYIEQCENFLTLRPLTDGELMATLSATFKGPAKSWWTAEKKKVKNWSEFRKSFFSAFLTTDYQNEVEEQLRVKVQGADQCIRDFVYDYRALCLRWKSDITEEELVRRVMNNCNPALVSGLRGTVHTVEQLVKLGSMVERDWAAKKDYWARVNSQASNDKSKKKGNGKSPNTNGQEHKGAQHMIIAKAVTPTLLVVPIETRGLQGEAVLDTGCTFTLMQRSLWQKMARSGDSLITEDLLHFVLADGKSHQAEGKTHLAYTWHGAVWTIGTYIMKDENLAFPLILGLDFLTKTQAQLNLGDHTFPLIGTVCLSGGNVLTFHF